MLVAGGSVLSSMMSAGVFSVSWLLVSLVSTATVAAGILVVNGVRWSRLPSLVILAVGVVGVVAFAAHVLNEPRETETEDMRPILVLGALMWAAGLVAPIVLLSIRREPRRPVPPGWRPDPSVPTLVRFWDGLRWTAHTERR